MNEPVPFMLNITEEAREIGSAKGNPRGTREGGMASRAENETHHQSIDSTPERKLDKGC